MQPISNTPALARTVLHELSTLLNTGVDRESLSILVQLVDSGVNPEALAAGTR